MSGSRHVLIIINKWFGVVVKAEKMNIYSFVFALVEIVR